MSSSSQSSLSNDNNISDNEPDGIDSLFVISSDEELDTNGEAEAQSRVPNATVMVDCTAAISEPLRQCHTFDLSPETCVDIGGLLAPTKSIDEKCQALNNLSNPEKYSYIFKHNSPPRVLPTTFSHGCNRKFKRAWMNTYPWLRYSTKLDGLVFVLYSCHQIVNMTKEFL